MRALALIAACCLSLAWGKDEVRSFNYGGQEGTVTVTQRATDPERAIDFVIVADGYSASGKERRRFQRDAKSIRKLFKKVEPFERYRDLFTVHVVYLPVADADGTHFDVQVPHPEPRNLMLFDLDKVDALLAKVGLEQAELVHVIYDVDRFGGTAAAGEGVSISSRNAGELNDILSMGLLWTVAHELGHSVAGLVEERPSAGLGEERRCLAQAGALPNAFAPPNGASGPSPADAPWKDWLPTAPQVVPHDDAFPYSPTFNPDKRPVGFFSGAASMPDAYRAQEHCLMRSDAHAFCVVCRQALIRAFYRLASPLRLVAEPAGDRVTLTALSGVPTKQRRISWTAPAQGDEVAGVLLDATREQRWAVELPTSAHGVTCTLVDETDWVRGGAPRAVATWPPAPSGLAGALGATPAPKVHGKNASGAPHACLAGLELPTAAELLKPRPATPAVDAPLGAQ